MLRSAACLELQKGSGCSLASYCFFGRKRKFLGPAEKAAAGRCPRCRWHRKCIQFLQKGVMMALTVARHRAGKHYWLLCVLWASCLLVAGCMADNDAATSAATAARSSTGCHAAALTEARKTDRGVRPGNAVELLLDGPETFNEMFSAIESAGDHINLETFILTDDVIGRRLATRLIERAQAGVVVNVVYDAIGSNDTDESFFDHLRDYGINLLAYQPLIETQPGDWLNRNHRKVLVIDGKIGFAGGLNFTENYRFSSDSKNGKRDFEKGWRDTHIKIEGPVVADLQREFLSLWTRTTEDEPVTAARYFPDLEKAGDQDVLIVAASGNVDRESAIIQHYTDAIAGAQSRVWITQAYFAPADNIVDCLSKAAARGVDVRLLLPGRSDVDLAVLAARAHYGELLASGVRIFECAGGILHAKTALVDAEWGTVGSSNLDMLSIEFNHELNAIVLDEEFVQQLAGTFLADLERAEEISFAEWDDRNFWTKLKHGVAKFAQGGI
jgi:cardiolipin synthase